MPVVKAKKARVEVSNPADLEGRHVAVERQSAPEGDAPLCALLLDVVKGIMGTNAQCQTRMIPNTQQEGCE